MNTLGWNKPAWVPQYQKRETDLMETWGRTKSGLIIPHADRKAQYGTYPLAFDLFAGCGGFSLGFIQAGWRVIGAVEWDEWAALAYMHNLGTYPISIHYPTPEDKTRLDKAITREAKTKHGLVLEMPLAGHGWISKNRDDQVHFRTTHPDAPDFAGTINEGQVPGVPHFWFGDIRKISGTEILDTLGLEVGDLDCVIGGPPCQGFSTSGKRQVMDPRNSLVFEFTRLVNEMKPATMLMENVPAMASMTTPEGINVVDAICKALDEGGYGRYEALKRALSTNPQTGAAWEGGKQVEITGKKPRNVKERKKQKRQGKKAEHREQPSLFDLAEAAV